MAQVVAAIMIGLVGLVLAACVVYILGFVGSVIVSAWRVSVDAMRTRQATYRAKPAARCCITDPSRAF